MECMPFPTRYKKALLSKTKNSTIRIKDERGRYTAGKMYSAKSYAGRIWNVKIKILKIFPTTLDKLSHLGIPKSSIEAIKKREKISFNRRVELIRFKVI